MINNDRNCQEQDQKHKSDSIALYIHWPYCLSKCNYCAFNSIASHCPDTQSWYEAITKELDCEVTRLKNRKLSSIYFGGGTPSLIPPKYVGNIINRSFKYWSALNEKTEITLETNPVSLNRDKLKDYLSAGVNRLSIGIQSFDDNILSFLERKHTAKQAEKSFETARNSGFSNISIDLIFAIPGQTQSMLRHDIECALALEPQHISIYQLSIEEGTKLHRDHMLGTLVLPNEEEIIQQFDLIHNLLSKAGYQHYEISNFAKSDYESQHNLAYWRYQEYLGLGPGAHSRIRLNKEIIAIERIHNIQTWITNSPDAYIQNMLNENEILTEILIMGLRTAEGVNLTKVVSKIGNDKISELLSSRNTKNLVEAGLITVNEHYISICPKHYLKTDAIVKELLK